VNPGRRPWEPGAPPSGAPSSRSACGAVVTEGLHRPYRLPTSRVDGLRYSFRCKDVEEGAAGAPEILGDGLKRGRKTVVIEVTRLDGHPFTLNADLIETIDANPDTFIRLLNGNSYLVRESRQEVVDRIVAYRRAVFQCAMMPTPEGVAASVRPDPETEEGTP